MSELYDDDSFAVSKTIKLNDCMKVSKKLGSNHEQITKLVKVKEHTRTWIKNVEKTAKTRNESQTQYLVNIDRLTTFLDTPFQVKTPLQYVPALPVSYTCSFCGQGMPQMTVQFHETLSQPYVLLCDRCQAV
jgi:CRISPR/Cas system CMR subunit Cmr6 (Cas7 group RAMP superfamily)